MLSRTLRSVAYYTPWQLLLGLLVGAVLFFAASPLVYNLCTHHFDLNPAHRCYIVNGRPK